MAQPRFAFWLSLAAAVWVAAVSLSGGFFTTLLGAPFAAALGAGAMAASRTSAKTPRRVIGAGAVACLFALAHLLLGGGGALVSVAFAVGVLYAGTQLSLERLPVAPELLPRSPRGPALAAAVAADELLLLAWDWNGAIGLPGAPAQLAERLRAAAERNRERGWLDEPERAHPVPPALEKPSLAREAVRRIGNVEHLRFESEFEPFDPEARDAFLAARANRTAHAWLLRHGDRPRPTVVCLHGYTSGNPAIDARAFRAAALHRENGLDVALFTMPLHGLRASGRSGRGFLGGDPLVTNAAFAQAVWDLRRLTGWLRAEGAPLVAVQGGSLGGYTAALYASLDPRLAAVVARVPAVRFARLVWTELADDRRRALEGAGVTESLLDEAWASHAILRHRPRVAKDARLIVAGAADRLCTPEHARALWDHWDRPELHWFPGSHLVPLGQGGMYLRVATFLRQRLDEAAIAAAPPEAPAAAPPPALSRFRVRGAPDPANRVAGSDPGDA